jgi:hypothetical protein
MYLKKNLLKTIMAKNKRAKIKDVGYQAKRSSAGLGLFATKQFKRSDFIIEYIGERMLHEDADEKGGKYMFRLNKEYTIDGSPRWNTARYINHACKPNAYAQIEDDEHIMIYAKKKIMPGEEITYNYGKEYTEEYCDPCLCATCQNK